MKVVIASTAVLLVLAGVASERAASGQSARARGSVQTLVRIPTRVTSFAQSDRYLAWIRESRGSSDCDFLTIREVLTGRRTSIRFGCVGVYPETLVLAGGRAYWEMAGASNLTEFSDLLTASPSDRKVRTVSFQSIFIDGLDHRVPPVSDGRSAYYWTSPDDATPGPLSRFDGRREKPMTSTISRLSALAAADGRYAFATATWTFDCAREPAWSPSGEQIAFASAGDADTNCRGGLWVMAANGAGARRLAARGRNPDWSPDGSKVAYDDGEGSVVVADASGDNAHTVLPGTDPVWSPDGSRLAYTREHAIFVAAADGNGERLITTGAVEPDWSPDGTALVFARTDARNRGLGIIGADGTGARSLTSSKDQQPAWSPDGRKIAFAYCATDTELWCASQIFEIAPDGTGRQARTSHDDEAAALGPAWAPDSRRLAFARSRDYEDEGDSHICTLSRCLTRTPRPQTPIAVHSRTGRLLARIDPSGEAVSLAVGRGVTAALVRAGGDRRVEIYSPSRRTLGLGKSRGAVTLAASGKRLVVGVGRRILLFHPHAGRLTLVARASSTPLGLSIAGRRIAWAENVGRRARVRAVILPRS